MTFGDDWQQALAVALALSGSLSFAAKVTVSARPACPSTCAMRLFRCQRMIGRLVLPPSSSPRQATGLASCARRRLATAAATSRQWRCGRGQTFADRHRNTWSLHARGAGERVGTRLHRAQPLPALTGQAQAG
jgi:hypothetical protein